MKFEFLKDFCGVYSLFGHILSVESQKGIIAVQRGFVENQKDTIAVQSL